MAGYIGSKVAVVSSGAERKKVFTATSGQTSFTGLSYTVNNVHVFQNGVRLVDGTDYTATNGNSITLTVGAATDDQVVVVSYNTFQTSDTVSASTGGTFAGDVNFTGAFTSQGIDDNATSTAMTLDASGNLLVGKTATDSGTVGFEAAQDGHVYVTVNNTLPFYINRQSGDEMLRFASNGATVGKISSVSSSRLKVSSNDVQGYFFLNNGTANASNKLWLNGSLLAWDDSAYDIGSSTTKFKDLYLSGGVYLGGTGSANKLDDYETGTFTMGVTFASNDPDDDPTQAVGYYVKTGNSCTIWVRANDINVTGGAGDLRLNASGGNDGLPFVSLGIGTTGLGVYHGQATISNCNVASTCVQVNSQQIDAVSYIRFTEMLDSGATDIINVGNCTHGSTDIDLCMTYPVA